MVAGRVRSGSTRWLHRQSFASIQLPSISGPINEGLEGRAGRGQRGLGGGNGQVSEEAQNGNKEGASSDPRGIPAKRQQEWRGVAASCALQKMPIKKLHLVLLSFFNTPSAQMIK